MHLFSSPALQLFSSTLMARRPRFRMASDISRTREWRGEKPVAVSLDIHRPSSPSSAGLRFWRDSWLSRPDLRPLKRLLRVVRFILKSIAAFRMLLYFLVFNASIACSIRFSYWTVSSFVLDVI